jgi:hypothetical protein
MKRDKVTFAKRTHARRRAYRKYWSKGSQAINSDGLILSVCAYPTVTR